MLNKREESRPLPEDDEEAAAAAAASREEGTAVIRSHLDAHLQQNPDASYVSWIATLHPENAQVTIDPRFFTPGNPWWTVYEEGKATLHVNGVPVDDEPENQETTVTAPAEPAVKPPKNLGGLVAFLIGFMLCMSGILVAFVCEVTAVCFYLVAVGFKCICKCLSNPRVDIITALPFAIFWIMFQAFRLSDSLLLLINVGVVELLAGINCALVGMFALDCEVGRGWHQQTRRLAHLTRWAFRYPFTGLDPPRMFGASNVKYQQQEEPTIIPIDASPSKDDVAPVNAMPQHGTEPAANAMPQQDDNVIVIDHADVMVVDDYPASSVTK